MRVDEAWRWSVSVGVGLIVVGLASPLVDWRGSGPEVTSSVDAGATATVSVPPEATPRVTVEYYWSAPVWDDREISDAAKAADPIYDPRWPAFEACMESEGVTVRADTSRPFAQADLDALVARINALGPPQTSEGGRLITHHSPLVDAYLACKRGELDQPAPQALSARPRPPGPHPNPSPALRERGMRDDYSFTASA